MRVRLMLVLFVLCLTGVARFADASQIQTPGQAPTQTPAVAEPPVAPAAPTPAATPASPSPEPALQGIVLDDSASPKTSVVVRLRPASGDADVIATTTDRNGR